MHPVPAAPHLVALPPPPPPPDFTPAALHIPLSAASSHPGRKVRTTGQILSFHSGSSLLLLASAPTKAHGERLATLLVDVKTVLLGQSPVVADLTAAQEGFWTSAGAATAQIVEAEMGGKRRANRERMRLDRGEWVVVVGWLEGDGGRVAKKIPLDGAYLPPPPVILEAIHLSMAWQPDPGQAYRGHQVSSAWSGNVTPLPTGAQAADPERVPHRRRVSSDDEVDVEEITPRGKKRR